MHEDQESPLASLPKTAWWQRQMVHAEQEEGWLIACEESGRYLALSRELVDALAERIRRLTPRDNSGPVVELCAGRGELAQALRWAGIRLLATDPCAETTKSTLPTSDHSLASNQVRVEPWTAESALDRYRPTVVLGSFVPYDAGIDRRVFACDSTRHYIVLGARIGGVFGSPTLWNDPAWKATLLEEVTRWMITRHDVWLPSSESPADGRIEIIQHGEAWHFERVDLE